MCQSTKLSALNQKLKFLTIYSETFLILLKLRKYKNIVYFFNFLIYRRIILFIIQDPSDRKLYFIMADGDNTIEHNQVKVNLSETLHIVMYAIMKFNCFNN